MPGRIAITLFLNNTLFLMILLRVQMIIKLRNVFFLIVSRTTLHHTIPLCMRLLILSCDGNKFIVAVIHCRKFILLLFVLRLLGLINMILFLFFVLQRLFLQASSALSLHKWSFFLSPCLYFF